MNDEVRLVDVAARPTVVIAASTTWPEFPKVWSELSNEVWACVRASGITSGARNVMLYLDDVPNVEIGVLLSEPIPLTGRVVVSALPAGRVAMTEHYGSYADLGSAHDAFHEWCAAHGERLSQTRWEIYGPHHDDVSQVWVEVYWLLTKPPAKHSPTS